MIAIFFASCTKPGLDTTDLVNSNLIKEGDLQKELQNSSNLQRQNGCKFPSKLMDKIGMPLIDYNLDIDYTYYFPKILLDDYKTFLENLLIEVSTPIENLDGETVIRTIQQRGYIDETQGDLLVELFYQIEEILDTHGENYIKIKEDLQKLETNLKSRTDLSCHNKSLLIASCGGSRLAVEHIIKFLNNNQELNRRVDIGCVLLFGNFALTVYPIVGAVVGILVTGGAAPIFGAIAGAIAGKVIAVQAIIKVCVNDVCNAPTDIVYEYDFAGDCNLTRTISVIGSGEDANVFRWRVENATYAGSTNPLAPTVVQTTIPYLEVTQVNPFLDMIIDAGPVCNQEDNLEWLRIRRTMGFPDIIENISPINIVPNSTASPTINTTSTYLVFGSSQFNSVNIDYSISVSPSSIGGVVEDNDGHYFDVYWFGTGAATITVRAENSCSGNVEEDNLIVTVN